MNGAENLIEAANESKDIAFRIVTAMGDCRVDVGMAALCTVLYAVREENFPNMTWESYAQKIMESFKVIEAAKRVEGR